MTNALAQVMVLQTATETSTSQEALTNLDGFEQSFGVNFITERSPFQQGSTTVDVQSSRRFISFSLHLFKETQDALYTRVGEIIDFLNPFLGEITLVHSNIRNRRIIARYKSHVLNDSTRTVGYGVLNIFLEADSSFFEDFNLTIFEFGGDQVLFEMGVELPAEFGSSALAEIIANSGSYITPVIIEFNGPTTNPKIFRDILDSGGNILQTDSLEFELVLTTTQILRVNTETGLESATVFDSADNSETNVNKFLSAKSVYWQLFLGNNVVRFTVETGSPKTVIQYRQRYITA